MVLLPSKPERRTLKHLKNRWGVARTGQISKQGVVELWERWDGSVDAEVRPEAFRIRIGPGVGPEKIAELEAAVRAHEQAATPSERAAAAKRLAEAKRALGG